MDLPKLMFIDKECGNLKVVVDGGQFTTNNDRKMKSEALQAYICPLCDKCYRQNRGKYGFSCGYIFSGQLVNRFLVELTEITLT